ncbi:hypothetical protein [Pseudoflavitalea rhizosphaerae]|nr:hypothetical protein [Pseudoflavitalea rhizosphaerae]
MKKILLSLMAAVCILLLGYGQSNGVAINKTGAFPGEFVQGDSNQ